MNPKNAISDQIGLLGLIDIIKISLCSLCLMYGLMVFMGYSMQIEFIYRPFADGPATHPVTALTMLLLGIGLTVKKNWRTYKWVPMSTAILVLLFTMTRMSEIIFGSDILSYVTPYKAQVNVDSLNGLSNSMGLNSAIMMAFISAGLLFHLIDQVKLSQIMSLLGMLFPSISILGYTLGLDFLYGEMSMITLLGGFALSSSALLLSADRFILKAYLSDSFGNFSTRILKVNSFAIVMVLGFLLTLSVIDSGTDSLPGIILITTFFLGFILITFKFNHVETNQHRSDGDTDIRDAYHNAIIENSSDAIISKTLDGIITSWNPGAEKIFGYSSDEMIGCSILKLFPDERQYEEKEIIEQLKNGNKIEHYRTQRLHKKGRVIDIDVTISPILNPDGMVVGVSKIARDISQQILKDRMIAQYKAMVDFSEDAIISLSLSAEIVTWNASAERIFGYREDQVLGKHISFLYPRDKLDEESRLLKSVRRGKHVKHFRTSRITSDSKRIYVAVSISAIRNHHGKITGFSKIVRDLTHEFEQEMTVWTGINYDSVTGLLNKIGIQNAVDDYLQIAHVRNQLVAVVAINIDNYKDTIMQYSYDVAEKLLSSIGQTIRQSIREADDAAHLYAERFVVVLHGFNTNDNISQTIYKLKQQLEESCQVDDQIIRFDVSIGSAVGPEEGKNFEVLLNKAEKNMMNNPLFHPKTLPGVDNDSVDKLPDNFYLVQALRHAISNQELRLNYQPIVDAGTGEIKKAEALLRWHHPEFGAVSPAIFIPLAEKYGLINQLSCWVVDQAFSDMLLWTDIFGMDFQVSINFSSYDLNDIDTCIVSMREALHRYGLMGSNVFVEVTEYSLIGNPKTTISILNGFRDLGIQIALDDFGTGYASLEYLKIYPIDIIKIDRSFVTGLGSASKDVQICKGIVSMGKSMGLQIVAEGVEEEAVWKNLNALGVEFIQGYYFSKPLEKASFEDYLRTHS